MKNILLLLFCAIILSFQVVQVSAQKTDVYKVIPQSQRESFKSRLDEFISANEKKDWNKVFSFITENFTRLTDEEVAEDSLFVIRNAEYFKVQDSIKKFTPQKSQKLDDDFYQITGCGTFIKNGERMATSNAYYENNNWYFSPIWEVGRYYSNKPVLCEN